MNYMGFYNSYGTLNAAEADPPIAIVEPLSLAEVKNHLRVDFADDDLLIGLLISAARAQANSGISAKNLNALTVDALHPTASTQQTRLAPQLAHALEPFRTN